MRKHGHAPHRLSICAISALAFALTPSCSDDEQGGFDPVETGPTRQDVVEDAPPADTGTADTGQVDTGTPDTGAPDTGPADTGPADTGPEDTGPEDTGPLDTGVADTGPEDTGPQDTGPPDTGPADTGVVDTGPADTGPEDTGVVDTGVDTVEDTLDVADTVEDVVDTVEDTVDIVEEMGCSLCDPPEEDHLVIAEVLANPVNDPVNGDSNCDGARDAEDDEFVEIVNVHDQCVDLSGVTVSDAAGVKYAFDCGVTLEPNEAAVVWGGGTPDFDANPTGTGDWCIDLSGFDVQLFESGGGAGLSLANSGDSVILKVGDDVIDEMSFTNAPTQSLVRDPFPGGDFVRHGTANPDLPFSPGTRSDGTSY